jgi:DNA-binding phage protein
MPKEETYQVFIDIKDIICEYDFHWLSETAGVSQQTLYNWHHGITSKPRIDTLTKVAAALGYDLTLTLREQRRMRSVA